MTNESLAFPAIFLSKSAQPLFSPSTFQHCAEHENSVRGLFNRSSFKISVTHKWNYSTGEESTLPPRFSPLSPRPCPLLLLLLRSRRPGFILEWIQVDRKHHFWSLRGGEGRGKWNLIKGDDSINFRLIIFDEIKFWFEFFFFLETMEARFTE